MEAANIILPWIFGTKPQAKEIQHTSLTTDYTLKTRMGHRTICQDAWPERVEIS
jgi:hypothetical protein